MKNHYAPTYFSCFTIGSDAVHRFVQDNHSCSVRNVIRGLHYQVRPPRVSSSGSWRVRFSTSQWI